MWFSWQQGSSPKTSEPTFCLTASSLLTCLLDTAARRTVHLLCTYSSGIWVFLLNHRLQTPASFFIVCFMHVIECLHMHPGAVRALWDECDALDAALGKLSSLTTLSEEIRTLYAGRERPHGSHICTQSISPAPMPVEIALEDCNIFNLEK